MEVLDTQGDWTHVRLTGPDRGQKTGWIMSQYLVTRLPWEIQAKTLNEENARLKRIVAQQVGYERHALAMRCYQAARAMYYFPVEA